MRPEEADRLYTKEWPALNAAKERAVEFGTPKEQKRARQALNALSMKYSDRHIPEFVPLSLEERVIELELRVRKLESSCGD